MAVETSGVDRYDETTLLDNRTVAQMQVVTPGSPSNGRAVRPVSAAGSLQYLNSLVFVKEI